MKFSYSLTPEAQERYFVDTGKRVMHSCLEIEDAEATPEQRQKYLDLNKALDSNTVHIGEPFVSKVHFGIVTQPVDHLLTPENVWPLVDQMLEKLPAVREEATKQRAEREQAQAEAKRKVEEMRAKTQADREARLEREAAERAARVAVASNIQYGEDGKAVIDLLDALFLIVPDEQDTRFNNWAKEVAGIDMKDDNGYTFTGKFINEGTIEIERRRRVYLVASAAGSRKYQTTTYRVIVMDEAGQLKLTDITTTNDKPGWALRIRDQVKALLV